MEKNKIKVGFCVAYDWNLLEYSLPLVYADADEICLALDKDNISWSGNKYAFDKATFYSFVKELDVENKIRIIEEDFHLSQLSPMENEVKQRNRIASILGKGGWHIQLDADEYFVGFNGFAKWLRGKTYKGHTTIMCPAINLWKKVGGGFVYVKERKMLSSDLFSIASNYPKYVYGRREDWFSIVYPVYFIHQSWARNIEEVKEKIANWGHSNDFDTNKYVELWNRVDANNYQSYKNMHPVTPKSWESLGFLKGTTISDLIDFFDGKVFNYPSKMELLIRNSIWVSRLKKYCNH